MRNWTTFLLAIAICATLVPAAWAQSKGGSSPAKSPPAQGPTGKVPIGLLMKGMTKDEIKAAQTILQRMKGPERGAVMKAFFIHMNDPHKGVKLEKMDDKALHQHMMKGLAEPDKAAITTFIGTLSDVEKQALKKMSMNACTTGIRKTPRPMPAPKSSGGKGKG